MSCVIQLRFFFPQNNPIDLDPAYKMDLDLLDCFHRIKFFIITEETVVKTKISIPIDLTKMFL